MQQGMKSRPAGSFQLAESGPDENAVLSEQGDDVGHGSERHEIEILPKIKSLNRAGFLHGMAELEDDPGTAEIMEIGAELRIHECIAESGGVLRIGLMMVEDHQIASGLAEVRGFGARVGSAVDGHNEARERFPEAACHACLAQSVSLGGAVGDEALHDPSGGAEVAAEDREGGDAVDIVVAIKGDPFL